MREASPHFEGKLDPGCFGGVFEGVAKNSIVLSAR